MGGSAPAEASSAGSSQGCIRTLIKRQELARAQLLVELQARAVLLKPLAREDGLAGAASDDDLVGRADRQLCRDEHGGRDRVCG